MGGGGGGGTEGGADGGDGFEEATLPDEAAEAVVLEVVVPDGAVPEAAFVFADKDEEEFSLTLVFPLSGALSSFCVAAATFVTALHEAVNAFTDCSILS